MTLLFLEQGFQHIVCAKKINERKMTIFSINQRFSRQQKIQKIIVLKCYVEKDESVFLTESSPLGQDPTFKPNLPLTIIIMIKLVFFSSPEPKAPGELIV